MLDAAMAIALQEGVDKLTIAHLARRLDAAVGALYRYFPSKSALMMAMQRRAIEALRGDLEQTFARAEAAFPDAAAPVRALAAAMLIVPSYLADATAQQARHNLIDRVLSVPEPVLSDDHARDVDEVLRPIIELVSVRLQGAVDLGAINAGDPAQRTHLLWALSHGLDHFRKRDRIQPPALRVDMLVGHGLRALFIGWGATEADTDAALGMLGAIAPIAWGCEPV